MKKWHETVAANFGLRAGGLVLLAVCWAIAARLHPVPPGATARDAMSLLMLLSAMAFLCGSAGSALLFAGPGLWETVEVSERWRRLPAPDRLWRAPRGRGL